MEKQETQAAPQWKRPQDIVTFRTSDPKIMRGMYLAENVKKTYTEDFLDEDDGTVHSIERQELIMERGMELDADRIATIQFHIQAGEITDVLVTDSNVSAERYICPVLEPYEVCLSVRARKKLYLVRAQSVEQAIQIATDYASMYLDLKGWYSVRKVNTASYRIIEDDNGCIPQGDDDVKTSESEYYNVTVQLRLYDSNLDLEKTDYDIIIKAHDVGQAKERVSAYVEENMQTQLAGNPNNSFVVKKAKPYDTAGVVPKSYCEMYFVKTDY